MTATTTTNNFSNLDLEEATNQVGSFLKEHGEVEMILPVALGVFITSQFKLRGSNALLVNILVASLARQIFSQLKQEKSQAITGSSDSAATVKDAEQSESNLEGYEIVHAIPGRVRLRMPLLAIDAGFASRLQQALEADDHVKNVRINRAAVSITINYDNQGLSDWELGMRLMNIINTIQKEHQVPQSGASIQ